MKVWVVEAFQLLSFLFLANAHETRMRRSTGISALPFLLRRLLAAKASSRSPFPPLLSADQDSHLLVVDRVVENELSDMFCRPQSD